MQEVCMRFGGQKAATALLLLLGLTCSMRIAAQDLESASSMTADPVQLTDIQAAAAAAAADPALSMQRLSTRQGGPIQKPAGKTLLAPNRKLTKLPSMRPLSMRAMKAEYTGAQAPMTSLSTGKGPIDSQAYGTSGASFSSSRFSPDYYTLGKQRVGALFTRFGGDWYICTASVINRALLVTAAHCVCRWGQGNNCFPDVEDGVLQVAFDLGRENQTDTSFLGDWTAGGIMVPPTYARGTDTSVQVGVVVNNDLALVWLNGNDGMEIGDVGGWNSYGMNGYSFSMPAAGYGIIVGGSMPASAMLTQLGYPAAFDRFGTMQITNAATYNMKLWNKQNPGSVKNVVRGSALTGGSSGGPWIANYGLDADLRGDATYGQDADRNVVMAVTSWGYEDPNILLQGASFFGTNKEYPGTYGTRGSGNIAKLMYDACDNPAFPTWNLKAKGLCV